MLDGRRYPADFWATVGAANDAYGRGDDQTMIAWVGPVMPSGHPEVGLESLRHRGGWIESSRDYRVRSTGRAGLDYSDSDGELHIDSEMMATPAVVIYTDSIPEYRSRVLERVMRAWLWAGLDVNIYPPRPL